MSLFLLLNLILARLIEEIYFDFFYENLV